MILKFYLNKKTYINIKKQDPMPEYKQGKIYAIRSNQTDQVYIGSTTQALCVRMAEHRRDYKKFLSKKHNYVTSFELIKIPGAYIELLEEFPCTNKEQLLKREGEVIRATANCVNRCIAGRTKQEYGKQYRVDNEQKVKQYRKQWYADNKQEINEQHKQYRINNKEQLYAKQKAKHACLCGGKYTHQHKTRHEQSQKHQNYLNKQ
jgi:GIY-YIG catalytic domain